MYNFYGWSEHWVTKNGIVMPLGSVVHGWAGWTAATGDLWLDQESVIFIGMVALYAAALTNLQDFRDVEGDQKVGRKTMPVQFGMTASVYAQSFLFLIQFAIFYSVMFSIHTPTLGQGVVALADLALRFYFIVRLLLVDHTPADYHNTYHSFTYHYFLFVLSGLVYL